MGSRRRGDRKPKASNEIVEFTGDLQVSQAASLHAALTRAAAEFGDLKINCQNLMSLDASILQLLVHWRNRLQATNQRLVLIHASETVRHSLLIGGWPDTELTTEDAQAVSPAVSTNC